jgi:hypothetical protein
MRIAQVAPLAESIPPQLYGGTERVVSWLIEELRRGAGFRGPVIGNDSSSLLICGRAGAAGKQEDYERL